MRGPTRFYLQPMDASPSDALRFRPPLLVRLARIPGAILSFLRPFRADPPIQCANSDSAPAPKISVVVPSHNYQDLIRQTLDSLLAQTYQNFEIVVVDDGSTDRSVEVVDEYVRRRPDLVRLHRHPGDANLGLAATLRLGAEKASGAYVAFCEADDLWMPNHLEEIVRAIQAYGTPAWIANDVEIFGDPWRGAKMELANARRIRARCRRTLNRFSFAEFRRANWVLTFSACLVARAEFLALDFAGNPWPQHADWWLWRQMAARHPLVYVNRKLTAWRMHRSYVTQAQPTPERWKRFREDMDALLAAQMAGRRA